MNNFPCPSCNGTGIKTSETTFVKKRFYLILTQKTYTEKITYCQTCFGFKTLDWIELARQRKNVPMNKMYSSRRKTWSNLYFIFEGTHKVIFLLFRFTYKFLLTFMKVYYDRESGHLKYKLKWGE